MLCCHGDCHRRRHTFCWQETHAAACKVWREFAEAQLAQSMSLLGAQHDELMTTRQETEEIDAMVDENLVLSIRLVVLESHHDTAAASATS